MVNEKDYILTFILSKQKKEFKNCMNVCYSKSDLGFFIFIIPEMECYISFEKLIKNFITFIHEALRRLVNNVKEKLNNNE